MGINTNGLFPDEIAGLERIEAGEALPDPVEEVTPEPKSEAAAAPAEEPAAAEAGSESEGGETDSPPADEALTPEQLAAVAGEEMPEPPPAKLPTYTVSAEDYEAKLKQVRADIRAASADWDAGKMDDEAYRAKVDELEMRREQLLIEKTRAETIADLNEQNRKAAIQARQDGEESAMKALATRVKATVDYANDKVAVKQFDVAYEGLLQDPDIAKLPVAEVVEKAHAAVLAMRGIAAPAKGAQPQAEPRARPAAPRTLAGVPAAAAQPIGDDIDARLSAITDPDEREEQWARLPQAQRDAMLRATLRH